MEDGPRQIRGVTERGAVEPGLSWFFMNTVLDNQSEIDDSDRNLVGYLLKVAAVCRFPEHVGAAIGFAR
jgi:hypothetical protein